MLKNNTIYSNKRLFLYGATKPIDRRFVRGDFGKNREKRHFR